MQIISDFLSNLEIFMAAVYFFTHSDTQNYQFLFKDTEKQQKYALK